MPPQSSHNTLPLSSSCYIHKLLPAYLSANRETVLCYNTEFFCSGRLAKSVEVAIQAYNYNLIGR